MVQAVNKMAHAVPALPPACSTRAPHGCRPRKRESTAADPQLGRPPPPAAHHMVEVGRDVGEGEGGLAVDGDVGGGALLPHADGPRVVNRVLAHPRRAALGVDQANVVLALRSGAGKERKTADVAFGREAAVESSTKVRGRPAGCATAAPAVPLRGGKRCKTAAGSGAGSPPAARAARCAGR